MKKFLLFTIVLCIAMSSFAQFGARMQKKANIIATGQRESSGTSVRSFAQTLGFVLGLRVVHLAIAIAASPSSFYAVYRLLGELVYELGILGGAALAAWLIESPAITGTTLLVDGGQHLSAQPRDVLYLAKQN